MLIYAEKICDMRILLKYAKKCNNKRNMSQYYSSISIGSSVVNYRLLNTSVASEESQN